MSTIFSDKDYDNAMDLFRRARVSPLTSDIIKRTVLPVLKKKERFLDIGAGPGRVTDDISSFFKETVTVEPKIEYAKNLKNRSYTVLPCEFQTASIEETFDFILCSQVLYHVKIEEWLSFVMKIWRLLNNDGIALVVLGAARGPYYEFCIKLHSAYHTSQNLIEILKKTGINFSIEEEKVFYCTDILEVMYTMCRFAVLEGCLTEAHYSTLPQQKQEEIDKKILNYAKSLHENGKYKLFFERDFIYLKKEGGYEPNRKE
ncbi:MAG: class I SAM-dependent methyltransferase [Gammaproteobacteria bacterium]